MTRSGVRPPYSPSLESKRVEGVRPRAPSSPAGRIHRPFQPPGNLGRQNPLPSGKSREYYGPDLRHAGVCSRVILQIYSGKALVAQLDRASDYESEGSVFESRRVHLLEDLPKLDRRVIPGGDPCGRRRDGTQPRNLGDPMTYGAGMNRRDPATPLHPPFHLRSARDDALGSLKTNAQTFERHSQQVGWLGQSLWLYRHYCGRDSCPSQSCTGGGDLPTV